MRRMRSSFTSCGLKEEAASMFVERFVMSFSMSLSISLPLCLWKGFCIKACFCLCLCHYMFLFLFLHVCGKVCDVFFYFFVCFFASMSAERFVIPGWKISRDFIVFDKDRDNFYISVLFSFSLSCLCLCLCL